MPSELPSHPGWVLEHPSRRNPLSEASSGDRLRAKCGLRESGSNRQRQGRNEHRALSALVLWGTG